MAFNSTAPNKLTSTLDLSIMFNSLMSQSTRVTKRSAFLGRYNVTSACPSQHSRGTGGGVSDTVWRQVEINQLLVFPGHQSVSVVVSLVKFAVQECYSDSCAVFLFQF